MKLVISSNFWSYMLISALVLIMLLVKILLFSLLTYIRYGFALSMSTGEVLKFTIAASHNKIDVVGES